MPVVPDSLYHYTNQAGLLGIISTSSIWATKIHYLNDSAEYEMAFDLCNMHLGKLVKTGADLDELAKIQALKLDLWRVARMNVCVASFSLHDDRLSQWRAYADGSAGFCLRFQKDKLAAIGKDAGYRLAPCVYEPKIHSQLIESLVAYTLKNDVFALPPTSSESPGESPPKYSTGGDFARTFAGLASELKSEAFKEEGEWRLVSMNGVNSEELRFRPGRSMLIPYATIGLDLESLLSITVGPTPHPRLAAEAVRSLLSSIGLAHRVEVDSSMAPYRAW